MYVTWFSFCGNRRLFLLGVFKESDMKYPGIATDLPDDVLGLLHNVLHVTLFTNN